MSDTTRLRNAEQRSNMANLFARSASRLAARFIEQGVSVTYTRGTVSHSLTAFPSNQVAQVDPVSGDKGRVEYRSRDYRFLVSDLKNAGLFPPDVGDRVAETIAGTATVNVAHKTPTTPVWEWSDPEHEMATIHTKLA